MGVENMSAVAARIATIRSQFGLRRATPSAAAATTEQSFESVLAGVSSAATGSDASTNQWLSPAAIHAAIPASNPLLDSAYLTRTQPLGAAVASQLASLAAIYAGQNPAATPAAAVVQPIAATADHAVRTKPPRGSQIPDELRSYGNGRLPSSSLQSIGHGSHKLAPRAAEAFRLMEAHARRSGVEIGITDSYRSYEAQVDVARRKGIYGQGGWAAVPGTSNHGWGLATDLDLNDKALTWMREHAWRFGFIEDTPREPWHWVYYGYAPK